MKHALLSLLFSSLLTGCGMLEWKDKILTVAAEAIPWDFENAMGDQLLPSILPPEMELKDDALRRELEHLLAPLVKGIDQPNIRIHISKDQELNAFAIPGGHLIFNLGMLRAVETPEEILGVAAHEIAHATERHTMRSMIQGLGIYAIITIFFGDISGLGAVLIDQSQALIQNGFSRSQERKADSVGLDRLIAAKINPQGMMRFFQRLENEGKERGQGSTHMAQFMSTHPLTAERIAEIKERVEEIPPEERALWKPVAFDLKAFQGRLGR